MKGKKMKKIKYFLLAGMMLASVSLAGCGEKAEDDITNSEIYEEELQPLTEEELDAMDVEDSEEDMTPIDDPEEEVE